MANVASQVILHPTSSATLKVLGTTVGRDKVRSEFMAPLPPCTPIHLAADHRYTERRSTLHASSRGISL